MSKQKTIFRIEEKALEHAQKFLTEEVYENDLLLTEFKILFENYKRIYKQFQSLIKISDHQQNCLNDLNKKLIESNASKDRFFSIISHDLRGPLGSLIGLSELLQEQIQDNKRRDAVSKLAHQVCSSAKDLHTLLENLLTWSRIQRNLIEYHPEDLGIQEILRFNVGLFAPLAAQKKIRLENVVSPGIIAHADYNVVSTVFRNIISNAIKFTRQGGSIEISGLASDNKTIELAVSDTGLGISPEKIARLFQIGIQCSSAGTAGEKGTGLGLILCKELLDKSGGRIWVESRVGIGTTVRFTLPGYVEHGDKSVSPEQFGSVLSAVSESSDPSLIDSPLAYRMLVVDDAPVNRQILVNILSTFGFRCREACNGQESLDIWETWQPHLIWMDIHMPVMNGYEAVKQIRATKRGRDAVIIGVSGSISKEEYATAIAVGYETVLAKPLKKIEIIHIIHEYMGISGLDKAAEERGICKAEEEDKIMISDQAKIYLPEIINKLEHEFLPKCKKINEIFFLDEIADFASDIRAFAFEYQLDFLIDYSQNLYNAVQINDILEIENGISRFSEIINKFLKIMKNEKS